MIQESEITHEGVVVSAREGSVDVMIYPEASCIGCKAKDVCNVSGSDNRIIRVEGNYRLSSGTRVEVSVSRSQGYFALFLGYILPLIVLITTLVILLSFSAGELLAGLIATGTTALYYFILYLSGETVSKKFSFRIKTI